MADAPLAVVVAPKSIVARFDAIVARIRPSTAAAIRIAALRRFATGITVLTVAGHAYLGFEQSIAQPVVAVLACYLTELLLETLAAKGERRSPNYLAPAGATIRAKLFAFGDFLLPAHITGLALGMLLYVNNRLDLFIVAAIVGIGSKYVFRAPVGGSSRHFFNPSNFGITATILLYPGTASIAAPYHYTSELGPFGDVALPIVLCCIGLFLNAVFTSRLPLIAAWLGGFVLQAAVRAGLDTRVDFDAALAPLTGMAVLLFTLYMVTDPGTTPRSLRGQVWFGLAVAATYGLLMSAHIVFGVFIALTIVCAGRGIGLSLIHAMARHAATQRDRAHVPGNLAADAHYRTSE